MDRVSAQRAEIFRRYRCLHSPINILEIQSYEAQKRLRCEPHHNLCLQILL
jgi:hypothetical protein